MKVGCVVVCYRPDLASVSALCAALAADGGAAVVVDNSEESSLGEGDLPESCTVIALGTNTGIAHAQNVGLRAAIDAGAEVIAFFDQDSTITPGFLSALVGPLQGAAPAITAALCVDDVSGQEMPAVGVSRYGWSTSIYSRRRQDPYPVDVVIASGTAATRAVFEIAGNMDASFFIDFVDTEWCLRCRSRNIPIHVVPTAVMQHRIGSRSIEAGVMSVLVHNPLRCYYQLRNCFLLFRRRHVPVLFAARQLLSVCASRILLLLFVENRRAYVSAYGAAITDGLRGVAGPRPTRRSHSAS